MEGNSRNVSTLHVLADAITTNTVGTMMHVAAYMNVIVSITATNATVQFQGSIQDTSDGLGNPNFANAPSASNQWDYIQVKDYEDDASLNGDEGIVFTTADTKIVEFNTNGLSWVNIKITANTGSVTARAKGYATA